MDESELKSFEIALELFREDTEGEVPAEDEDELPGLLDDFESALNGEPSPIELPADGTTYEVDIKTGEVTKVYEVEDLTELTEEEAASLPEQMEERYSFPTCSDRGAFTGWCHLDPELGDRVAEILGNHRINDYLLDLDRGEFVFVVWEEARKYSVRIDADE